MYNPRFEKDVFKRDVRNNVKTLFRKEVEEAAVVPGSFLCCKGSHHR